MKNKAKKLLVLITLTSAISLSSCSAVDYVNGTVDNFIGDNQQKFEGIEDLMYKTYFGHSVTADISDPIKVAIQNNVSEEEKQYIIDALEQFNKIEPNIEYILLDSDNMHLSADIKLFTNSDLLEYEYGRTIYKYDNLSAKMIYPLSIYIDADVIKMKDINNNPYYPRIIKHELMHTLGFCDIPLNKYAGQTIMSYANTPEDFTEMDITNLNKIYGDKLVEVVKPTKTEVSYIYKKEDTFEL